MPDRLTPRGLGGTGGGGLVFFFLVATGNDDRAGGELKSLPCCKGVDRPDNGSVSFDKVRLTGILLFENGFGVSKDEFVVAGKDMQDREDPSRW